MTASEPLTAETLEAIAKAEALTERDNARALAGELILTRSRGPILSTQTLDAIAKAEALTERDRALAELLELFGGDASLWSIAGDLAGRLRRFEITAYPRIEKGYREPRNTLETALTAIMRAGCPGSQRRVYGLLMELRKTDGPPSEDGCDTPR